MAADRHAIFACPPRGNAMSFRRKCKAGFVQLNPGCSIWLGCQRSSRLPRSLEHLEDSIPFVSHGRSEGRTVVAPSGAVRPKKATQPCRESRQRAVSLPVLTSAKPAESVHDVSERLSTMSPVQTHRKSHKLSLQRHRRSSLEWHREPLRKACGKCSRCLRTVVHHVSGPNRGEGGAHARAWEDEGIGSIRTDLIPSP
jgi:hypothetical protein